MWDVQWDADLGLHYMHARHYSPDLGRFLQPDPSRLDVQLFVYAVNSPISWVDPSGLVPAGAFRIYDRILTFMFAELRANSNINFPLFIGGGNLALAKINWFVGKVRTNGPWDFKRDIRTMIGDHGKRIERGDTVYYHSVRGVDWRQGLRWDFWGNYHYGYVGRALGFSEADLRLGAALEGPDPARDTVAIEMGFELWRTYRRNLKSYQISRHIAGNWHRLSRAGATRRFL